MFWYQSSVSWYSQHYLGLTMCPGAPPSPHQCAWVPPPPLPHNRGHTSSSFQVKFLVTTPVSTLVQHSLQNKGHAEMPHFPVSMLFSRLCHGKSVIQALFYSLIFCHLIAGGLVVFSAISRVSSFWMIMQTIWSLLSEKKKKTLCFIAPYPCS